MKSIEDFTNQIKGVVLRWQGRTNNIANHVEQADCRDLLSSIGYPDVSGAIPA